jgi:hypothetical protein
MLSLSSSICLLVFILKPICFLPLIFLLHVTASLLSLDVAFWFLISAQPPTEHTPMERQAETSQCPVSVMVHRDILDEDAALVSPWPELEGSVEDASNVNYEQFEEAPQELSLLLDASQTPPEIQNIVLNSLNKPEEAINKSGAQQTSEDPSPNPSSVELPGSREVIQVTPPDSLLDRSHSPTISNATPSLSTSRTTESSDESDRHGFKKATLSNLLSSTTNLIGSMKNALKDSSPIENGAGFKRTQYVITCL